MMKQVKLTLSKIKRFEASLREQEKSQATIEKYIRDCLHFYRFLSQDKQITSETTLAYKQYLSEHYQLTSVNRMDYIDRSIQGTVWAVFNGVVN